MKKRGFTLIEVLIVLFVFSMGLIVVVQSMNTTTRYISEMTQKTVALNLAREGIEAVYNIRNTNWKRRSSQKNICRLASDPQKGTNTCEADALSPGRRVVLGDGNARKMVRVNHSISLDDPILIKASELSNDYLLHYVPNKGRWIAHAEFNSSETEDRSRGVYWRVITVDFLRQKIEVAKKLDCSKGTDVSVCQDESAKELRFCSTVYYTHPYQGSVNVCSIMTNFQR